MRRPDLLLCILFSVLILVPTVMVILSVRLLENMP